jgi:hypothetical protein
VGQGSAPGVGSQHRAADATAGLRHTRPRGSQAAHAGARGGKMWVILRRIQRAYFRRNRRTGSRATSVAVRHRRRVHAHMHFSAVFHTKTLPVWADRAAEGSLASKPMRGDKMRVFSRVCARMPGWFPWTFLAKTRFWEVYATPFSAHVAGICPHIAGQLMLSRGTQRGRKNRAPRLARRGMSYASAALRPASPPSWRTLARAPQRGGPLGAPRRAPHRGGWKHRGWGLIGDWKHRGWGILKTPRCWG